MQEQHLSTGYSAMRNQGLRAQHGRQDVMQGGPPGQGLSGPLGPEEGAVDSRVVAAWGPAQRRGCGARGPWQRAVVKPRAPQTGGDELVISDGDAHGTPRLLVRKRALSQSTRDLQLCTTNSNQRTPLVSGSWIRINALIILS